MYDASSLRGIKQSGVGEAGAYAAITTNTANKHIVKHNKLCKIMAKKHHDEASVIRSLSKKGSIQVNPANMTIEILKNSTDVGNGSWGKIDYLRKIHGYVVLFTTKLSKKVTPKKISDDENSGINSKTAKREAKFNMAAMAKNAMRKAKTK